VAFQVIVDQSNVPFSLVLILDRESQMFELLFQDLTQVFHVDVDAVFIEKLGHVGEEVVVKEPEAEFVFVSQGAVVPEETQYYDKVVQLNDRASFAIAN